MSYRMSNTEKWKDLWFNNLSPHAKLLFFYFVENCDNAGFFEVNKKFMLFHTGFNEQELMDAGIELKKSYLKSKDGTIEYIDIKGKDKKTNKFIKTGVFALKKRLVEAIYGIKISMI